MRPVRVLAVDDSLFFRQFLQLGLQKVLPAGSQIVTAGDPFEARDQIIAFQPDVMVLDMEMPKMDGVSFLQRLLAQYDQPTIALTSEPKYREVALQAGAKDFMVKQAAGPDAGYLCTELGAHILRVAGVSRAEPLADGEQTAVSHFRLIALGASTGGTEALAQVVGALRPPLPPVVIVQHIPPDFSRLFAERLDRDSAFACQEAEDGGQLQANHIYVAPGDYQMRVRSVGEALQVSCTREARVNGHSPSVDVLFRSVAEQAGERAVGAIFTGMGEDGARGLLAMRQQGARVRWGRMRPPVWSTVCRGQPGNWARWSGRCPCLRWRGPLCHSYRHVGKAKVIRSREVRLCRKKKIRCSSVRSCRAC